MRFPSRFTTLRLIAWVTGPALCVTALAQTSAPQKPFTAEDWAMLHSATAAAVSSQGTILYMVSFGGTTGPTHPKSQRCSEVP
jgi:hypothetical protein